MSPNNSLPADIFQLDELEILVVVDNETDTLSSVDVGVPLPVPAAIPPDTLPQNGIFAHIANPCPDAFIQHIHRLWPEPLSGSRRPVT